MFSSPDFQLLYVDATLSKRVHVSSQTPAISVWNSALLRKRQSTELEDGGFGLLPIKDPYIKKLQNLKGQTIESPSTPPREPSRQVRCSLKILKSIQPYNL